MLAKGSNEITASFPSTMEYVPIVREFVADSLRQYGFTDKFSYRMEIMVDELVVNAVQYGSLSQKSRVDLAVAVLTDHVSLVVKDEGGTPESISEMQESLLHSATGCETRSSRLGLEIVKMLAESVEVSSEGETVTKVRVQRKGGNCESPAV
ncbi:ATP-binding protein [Chitinivibrio alkaliphilus]|uniref:Anti-sigma regulatory factor, serine/threonine protein kinase n=1 Tax=Chitinivibrio alkaliphilus ACht1 TaxID=1313304 RepID=U7DAE1_9BACT|nr:ATP-binding protein [Chitinivibrio alkaliphilus]ERP31360.1 anti-sigma regulatory factor, serine/threonine protein kinase [Chitinivibrio alkaliphilus ACht1]